MMTFILFPFLILTAMSNPQYEKGFVTQKPMIASIVIGSGSASINRTLENSVTRKLEDGTVRRFEQ